MAVKVTEMIALRSELATTLLAGLDTHFDEIVTGHSEFYSPVLEDGETLFDTRQQLELIRRQIVHHRDAIEAFDVNVVEKVHDSDKVSAEILRLTDVVTFKMRHVRDTCKGLFGEPSLKRVGLKGEIPRRSARLVKRGRLVQQGLRNPDLGLEPVFDSPEGEETMAPTQLAGRLEPDLSRLDKLVEARETEKREDLDMRARRRQTIRDFDRDIGGIARMLKGMLRVAGRPELAAVFRVGLRRFSRRPQDDAGEATVDEATAS